METYKMNELISLKDANGKYCTFKIHEFYEQLVFNDVKVLGMSLDMITALKKFCDTYYIKTEQDLINLLGRIRHE